MLWNLTDKVNRHIVLLTTRARGVGQPSQILPCDLWIDRVLLITLTPTPTPTPTSASASTLLNLELWELLRERRSVGGSCANRRLKIDRGTSLTRSPGWAQVQSSLVYGCPYEGAVRLGRLEWNGRQTAAGNCALPWCMVIPSPHSNIISSEKGCS